MHNKHTAAIVNIVEMDRPEKAESVHIDYGAGPGKNRSCLNAFLLRSPDGRLMQAVGLGDAFMLRESSKLISDVSDFSLLGVSLRPYDPEPKVERLVQCGTGCHFNRGW